MARTVSHRSGFQQRLLRSLRRAGVRRDEKLTVAFSGGYDSLALATALGQIRAILNVQLLLVHIDHRLRPGSNDDVKTCEQLAHQLELPLRVIPLEVGLAERAAGLGIEEAARRERYLALSRAAYAWQSRRLLLGHQANDQAETILHHLFRGSGTDGLAGMQAVEKRRVPWWTPSGAPRFEVTLVRPLLAETRASISAYVDSFGLKPVQDESNTSESFDRNWMRLHVLPNVLDRWPAAIETMQRSSVALTIDREVIDVAVNDGYSEALTSDRTLRTDTLRGMSESLGRRVVQRWLRDDVAIEYVSLDVVERVLELAKNDDQSRLIEIGGNQHAIAADACITTLEWLLSQASQTLPIACAGSCIAWKVEITEPGGTSNCVVSVPKRATPEVRRLQPGDRWAGTNRLVKEDLRLAGIHPLVRPYVLAVVADDEVLLIPAIYPTIRSRFHQGGVETWGVRWSIP